MTKSPYIMGFTELENLLLNISGGLEFENLTQAEKNLLEENGYKLEEIYPEIIK